MTVCAVVDTNVLVAGLGWSGPHAVVVEAVLDGRLVLVTSPPLLSELRRVLGYPRLRQVLVRAGMEPDDLVELIEQASVVVEPETGPARVRDPDDDRLIEAALGQTRNAAIKGGESSPVAASEGQ